MNTTGSIEHKVHPDLASLAVAHQGRSSIQATLNSAMYALGPKRRGRRRVSRSQWPDLPGRPIYAISPTVHTIGRMKRRPASVTFSVFISI